MQSRVMCESPDRRLLEAIYEKRGVGSTPEARITFLQTRLGYDSYHAFGGNETPEMELAALEDAYLIEGV